MLTDNEGQEGRMSLSVTPNSCQQSRQSALLLGCPVGWGERQESQASLYNLGGQVSDGNRAKVAGPGHGLERVCRAGHRPH